MAIFSVLLSVILSVYKVRNSTPKLEVIAYIIAGFVPYIIMYNQFALIYKIAVALSVTALTVVLIIAPEFFGPILKK
jgi:ABC-type transport system involved in cytochrome bd biosynthesis fused ATPase/permease subunit